MKWPEQRGAQLPPPPTGGELGSRVNANHIICLSLLAPVHLQAIEMEYAMGNKERITNLKAQVRRERRATWNGLAPRKGAWAWGECRPGAPADLGQERIREKGGRGSEDEGVKGESLRNGGVGTGQRGARQARLLRSPPPLHQERPQPVGARAIWNPQAYSPVLSVW